jgi:hypothetical protein
MLWEVKWLPKAPETQPDVVVPLVPACWLSVVVCVCVLCEGELGVYLCQSMQDGS